MVQPRRGGLALGLWLLLVAGPVATARAADEAEPRPAQSDDAVGWGEESAPPERSEPGAEPAQPAAADPSGLGEWRLGGTLSSDQGFWTERDASFAKARQSLDLELEYRSGDWRAVLAGRGEWDLAYRDNRASYTDEELDVYEYLLQLREAYVASCFGPLELTLGRQIVVQGVGDVLNLVDDVNPRDLREPGLPDVDELRLPVLATRARWSVDAHEFEVIGVHEADWGLRPPPTGDWSPVRVPILDLGVSEDREVRWSDDPDRFSWKGQQVFASWQHHGSRADLGLHAASLLHQAGVIDSLDLSILLKERIRVPLEHERYTTLGHSGAAPLGDWVISWEAAFDFDRPTTVGSLDPLRISLRRRDQLTGLLGVRYEGFDGVVVSLEYSLGTDSDAIPLRDVRGLPALALHYTHLFLRDRLRLEWITAVLGDRGDSGWFGRVEAEYEIRDGLHFKLGFATYHPGDDPGPLLGFDSNDRLFFALRYDFDLL